VELERLADEVEEEMQPRYRAIERRALENHRRVLEAFRACGVSETHLRGSTGYGYGDPAREVLERVFARVFDAEAALVRGQIVSGTHALALCLFGILRAGDELLSVQGPPYETLAPVIGWPRETPGSLRSLGVTYREVALRSDGTVDERALREALTPRTRVVLLTRSCGYRWRPALTVDDVARVTAVVKERRPDAVVVVDNCYGEFVEAAEPTAVGADLVAGSLIKNPGGGIAPTGGYVAGRKEYVELASYRLTAPGLGGSVGPTLEWPRLFFQGFFMAPHVVAEALKGAVFTARLFERLGFEVLPRHDQPRGDIVQAVRLGRAEYLQAFCRGLQSASPVDSLARPEPGPLPGYDEPVLMAAGTFVQGASLELTADAPFKEPYVVYVQGGLSKEYVRLGVLAAARAVLDAQQHPAGR
jgi:cystathionine beta-lyase family protein involved in aluminum resistance